MKANYKKETIMRKNVFHRVVIASALAFCLIASTNISTAANWNGNNVNLVGYSFSDPTWNPYLSGSSLVLNKKIDQASAAWAVNSISTTSSFTTTFSFDLKNQHTLYYPTGGAPYELPMADGIAFVLQGNSNTALGGGGAGIGVDGLNAVGSAIQTWDSGNNRLGLFQGNPSNLAGTPINAAPFYMGIASEVSGTETISYNAATHTLSMTGSVNGYSVSDSRIIDLYALFGSTMYTGFTGGTGLSSADQQITSWTGVNTTSSVPEPATMLLFGLGLMGIAGIKRRFKK
jgi:hypothetical protein